MAHQQRGDHAARLRDALLQVDQAAQGDSNDAEIDALRHALDIALTRWPDLHAAHDDRHQPHPGRWRSDTSSAGADAEPPPAVELVTLPHTGIRVPDARLRVSAYRELPTPDGVAYTATLRLGRTPVGTIHNAGTGGPTSYQPAPDSPFGLRQLAAFVAQSRTADGAPITEEELLEELITEYEHTEHVRRTVAAGGSPLRLRAPLSYGPHHPIVYFTRAHRSWDTVTTPAQRAALVTTLQRTPSKPGEWWQLWTGQRWEDLTTPSGEPAQENR